jgi:hypothetical protein
MWDLVAVLRSTHAAKSSAWGNILNPHHLFSPAPSSVQHLSDYDRAHPDLPNIIYLGRHSDHNSLPAAVIRSLGGFFTYVWTTSAKGVQADQYTRTVCTLPCFLPSISSEMKIIESSVQFLLSSSLSKVSACGTVQRWRLVKRSDSL